MQQTDAIAQADQNILQWIDETIAQSSTIEKIQIAALALLHLSPELRGQRFALYDASTNSQNVTNANGLFHKLSESNKKLEIALSIIKNLNSNPQETGENNE